MQTRGRIRNRGIRTKQELQELYEHLDTAAGIKKRGREWIGHRVDHGRVVRKYLRVNRREEEEWENLDLDGCKILRRIYGRLTLKDGDRW